MSFFYLFLIKIIGGLRWVVSKIKVMPVAHLHDQAFNS